MWLQPILAFLLVKNIREIKKWKRAGLTQMGYF